MADIASKRNLNPGRRHRTYPRVVKRARHNSYRVKKPADKGTRHDRPPTITLVNLHRPGMAAWGAPSLPDCGPPVRSIRKGL